MIILTKRIELPDNATWEDIEDAKITADRNGWKREHTISQQERMLKTDLEGKCGSCKYFNLKPDLLGTDHVHRRLVKHTKGKMMAEKRYFWLKLYDDFFTSKRIKKLRTIAGGDTYTIIYLKMQLKALKTDGYLYFDGVMSDFAEELALDIDEKPDDVKITINYLLSVGLLETNDGEQYKLPFLDKCIGSETASTQRSRDCRARKKETKALQCNTNATDVQRVGNAEKEIEKRKSKNIYTPKENQFTQGAKNQTYNMEELEQKLIKN